MTLAAFTLDLIISNFAAKQLIFNYYLFNLFV